MWWMCAVNLWDNVDKGRSVVSVDFKAGGESMTAGRAHPFTLTDVHIMVPCKSKSPPEVTSKEGNVSFDNKEKYVFCVLFCLAFVSMQTPNLTHHSLAFNAGVQSGDVESGGGGPQPPLRCARV
jgi:hypothetical protein